MQSRPCATSVSLQIRRRPGRDAWRRAGLPVRTVSRAPDHGMEIIGRGFGSSRMAEGSREARSLSWPPERSADASSDMHGAGSAVGDPNPPFQCLGLDAECTSPPFCREWAPSVCPGLTSCASLPPARRVPHIRSAPPAHPDTRGSATAGIACCRCCTACVRR